MTTTRMQQLSSLAATIPVANERVAAGLQDARQVQMQSAIGQLTPEQAVAPGLAQQMGGQQATAAADIQLQSQQKTAEQSGRAGEQALAGQQIDIKKQLATRQIALSQKNRYLTGELARVSEGAKDTLLDKQLSFARDEMGRAVWNERQLADWAIISAKNDEDFRNFEVQYNAMSERKLKMLEIASVKNKQTLKQGFDQNEQTLTQDQRLRLAKALVELEKKKAKEAAKRSNTAAIFQGAGMIVGAVAGGLATGGSPQGIMIGAQLGGGAGQVVGSQVE